MALVLLYRLFPTSGREIGGKDQREHEEGQKVKQRGQRREVCLRLGVIDQKFKIALHALVPESIEELKHLRRIKLLASFTADKDLSGART
jgi:hypothetical protein